MKAAVMRTQLVRAGVTGASRDIAFAVVELFDRERAITACGN